MPTLQRGMYIFLVFSSESFSFILSSKSALHAVTKRSACAFMQAGVYNNALSMLELGLLLKTKCHGYWHERKYAESMEINKQLRQHYEAQKLAFVNGVW